MLISVVIPAKDESENIGALLAEISTAQSALESGDHFEVIVVDDGSSDDTQGATMKAAADSGIQARCIRHQHSVGQSAALLTGVRHASGQWIATMDGDGQNDPGDLPAMVAQAHQIKASPFCIAGNRWQRKDTPWKRFQSRLANRVRSALLHDGVPDTGCGLKLFPRETFLELPWFNHMHRFLPALVRSHGGVIEIVDVGHRDRQGGQSKYTAWNRVWVGIVDLFGVMWLQKRTVVPVIAGVSGTAPSNPSQQTNNESAG